MAIVYLGNQFQVKMYVGKYYIIEIINVALNSGMMNIKKWLNEAT